MLDRQRHCHSIQNEIFFDFRAFAIWQHADHVEVLELTFQFHGYDCHTSELEGDYVRPGHTFTYVVPLKHLFSFLVTFGGTYLLSCCRMIFFLAE